VRLPRPDPLTRVAHAARFAVAGGPLRAVERHREDPRRRGLADSARAREEIGVRDAAGGDRATQRGGDVLLGDQLAAAPGTVFAGEGDHPRTTRRVRTPWRRPVGGRTRCARSAPSVAAPARTPRTPGSSARPGP